MESRQKGVKLEKLVTQIFRSKGYEVKHNVKLTGRSKVEHQIDVYAEYKAPLHTSRIAIECKAYDKPVNKDIVMKLLNEVEDLGVDRGILITTSYFTSDAVSTAEGYNIELWDSLKLKQLSQEVLKKIPMEGIRISSNIFYIKPNISDDIAKVTVDNKLKGIFGRKGAIESSSIIFYPYFEVDIDARFSEKKGWINKKLKQRIVSSTILVDALKIALCDYHPEVGVVELFSLPDLTNEEARVFRMLRESALTTAALASLLSCSTSKARRIIQGLVVKGIAQQLKSGRQIFYRLRLAIPEPSSLRSVPSNLKLEIGEPEEGISLGAPLSLAEVENIVKLLWNGKIKKYKTIFYPYYACKIVENEKRYIKTIDMIMNNIDERMDQLLTTVYYQLRF